MKNRLLTSSRGLHGEISVPGDKSITHRAIMLGSIASGTTLVNNYLVSEDCERTIKVFRQMGVKILQNKTQLQIEGRQLDQLKDPKVSLEMGNSGTTLRLLLGLLVHQSFPLSFIGDESLSRRPLSRVTEPLALMGSTIKTRNGYLPATIEPCAHLRGIKYSLPVASAQVKSALILAALQAETPSVIEEKNISRDHTELMLSQFGITLNRHDRIIEVFPQTNLKATIIEVPGDFSSAAFWIVAALITPESDLVIKNVGVNPTRTHLITLLNKMGAEITLVNLKEELEPKADIVVKSQHLHGIEVTESDIPGAVDEIPLLVLAATQAKGETLITGAKELRVKETDRIKTVTNELNKLGACIKERPDGFIISGPTKLEVSKEVTVDSHGDHRIGMMLAVAALITKGTVDLKNFNAVAISYPTFFKDLASII